ISLAAKVEQPQASMVLLLHGNNLVAFDSQNGQLLWELRTVPELQEEQILFLDGNYLAYQNKSPTNQIFCLISLTDGQRLWCQRNIYFQEYCGHNSTDCMKRGVPVFEDGIVVIRPDPQTLQGISIEDQSTVWTFVEDEPVQPVRNQLVSHKLDVANGKVYAVYNKETPVLYAFDIQTGELLWETESIDIYHVRIIAHNPQLIFLEAENESPILAVYQATGEILGKITGPTLGIDHFRYGANRAQSFMAVDDNGLLVGSRASVTRFAVNVDEEFIVTQSRKLWDDGDRINAWLTLSASLPTGDNPPLDSPIVQTCRMFTEQRLIELHDFFKHRAFKRITDSFNRLDFDPQYQERDESIRFVSMARTCPGTEDLLAGGYFLAGEAFIQEASTDLWYKIPFENPYYKQLIEETPESPLSIEAKNRLKQSRQTFLTEWAQRQLVLILLAIGIPVIVYIAVLRNAPALALMLFFNLLIAGPWFDMTTFELRSLKAVWHATGFGLRLYLGGCITGCGCVVTLLLVALIGTSTIQPKKLVSLPIIAGIWLLNSFILLYVFYLMFPSPFN
ncbi:MAG: PQQ-binding-like beta-propeller repeat protein, partial [Chloroflexota bacterium]